MSHKMLRPFIVKVSVLGYFPLLIFVLYISLFWYLVLFIHYYIIYYICPLHIHIITKMRITGSMSNLELSLSITNLMHNIVDNNINIIFDEHKREIGELKDTIVDLKKMITDLTNL